MKKNIVQDVIPPKRSIRDVELPRRIKFSEKIQSGEQLKPDVLSSNPPVPPSTNPNYNYEYGEMPKRPKKILYFSVILLVLVLVFGISAFFKSAKIYITPRSEMVVLNENLKAVKDVSNNDLRFQTVSTTKDIEKTVVATEEKMVQKKATGVIVVYNNFGTQPQKLIKTTRFETPEGLIFRAVEDFVVPGTSTKEGKIIAGSVEVAVEADKPGVGYNIPLKDFTIVGFKGTSKYTKIYARSKTEMSGGFSGMQKVASQEVVNLADKELERVLKDSLSRDILSQIPENFVLYQDSISYKIEPITQIDVLSNNNSNTAILKKKGSVSAVIFDKGSLSRVIISNHLSDNKNDLIKITNLEELKFVLSSETSFNPSSSSSINFNLSGQANFVWIFDENKLKTDLLGLSKKNAVTLISSYQTIKEAKIETHPFWNQTIPSEPNKVTLVNTLAQ